MYETGRETIIVRLEHLMAAPLLDVKPVLVAPGASHPARFIIVSDDAGVQAACLSENVPCIGYKAFLKIHALS